MLANVLIARSPLPGELRLTVCIWKNGPDNLRCQSTAHPAVLDNLYFLDFPYGSFLFEYPYAHWSLRYRLF